MTFQINDLESTHLFCDLSDDELETIRGGLIADGTLNNVDVLSKIELLNTNINSEVSVSENRNANTRVEGKANISLFD